MTDSEKRAAAVNAARVYLQAEFPGRAIEEFSDPRRGGHGFGVRERGLSPVWLSDVFLEDTKAELFEGILRGWGLAAEMRRAGKNTLVMVATDGLRIEPLERK